mmetsp:Transcript_18081/g.53777  ORF Transcript_18081/g.53777 Transcript_18081/m.53777 type:complete len:261 (-) Transcript_18081:1225-2007(-)
MDMRHQRRQTRFSRRVATAWTLKAFHARHAWKNRDRRVMRMSADPADALSSAVLMPETALRNARSWSRSRSSSIKRYCATASLNACHFKKARRTARRSRAPRRARVTRSAPWLREESAFLASVVLFRHNKYAAVHDFLASRSRARVKSCVARRLESSNALPSRVARAHQRYAPAIEMRDQRLITRVRARDARCFAYRAFVAFVATRRHHTKAPPTDPRAIRAIACSRKRAACFCWSSNNKACRHSIKQPPVCLCARRVSA